MKLVCLLFSFRPHRNCAFVPNKNKVIENRGSENGTLNEKRTTFWSKFYAVCWSFVKKCTNFNFFLSLFVHCGDVSRGNSVARCDANSQKFRIYDHIEARVCTQYLHTKFQWGERKRQKIYDKTTNLNSNNQTNRELGKKRSEKNQT